MHNRKHLAGEGDIICTKILPYFGKRKIIDLQARDIIAWQNEMIKDFVACTRARHSIVFAVANPKENAVFKAKNVRLSDNALPAPKFTKEQLQNE